jgi:hypothetical protein
MNMNRFVQERDRAFTEFVQTGDLKAVRKYCRKHGVKIPENERVFKAGIYKAVQECRGIPQEVKDLAAVKCVELGFSPLLYPRTTVLEEEEEEE